MSDDNEKQGGVGAAGVIGAAGGGVAAAHFGSKRIIDNSLKASMSTDAKVLEAAPKQFKENLTKVFEKTPDLATRNTKLQVDKIASVAKDADKGLKATVAQTEKTLLTDIKSAGKTAGTKFNFNGLSGGMTGGKAKVIGLTVAGVAAGGLVMHKLFGGKHADKEAERRVQQDLGAYR